MSDEMVLAVRRSLTTTDGAVSGFQKVDEDGRTGWTTVRVLTRALQPELGITALSDSFGPATMNAIMTVFHGAIGPAQSENVRRLMQGGLYCTGDNPGAFDGRWGIGMGSACTRFRTFTPDRVRSARAMHAQQHRTGGRTRKP